MQDWVLWEACPARRTRATCRCPRLCKHLPQHRPALARAGVDPISMSVGGRTTPLDDRGSILDICKYDFCSCCRPACFDRPPAPSDSFYRYDDFEAFSLPSHALNHPWELHLPRELVSHDVNAEDWCVTCSARVMRVPERLQSTDIQGKVHRRPREGEHHRGDTRLDGA